MWVCGCRPLDSTRSGATDEVAIRPELKISVRRFCSCRGLCMTEWFCTMKENNFSSVTMKSLDIYFLTKTTNSRDHRRIFLFFSKSKRSAVTVEICVRSLDLLDRLEAFVSDEQRARAARAAADVARPLCLSSTSALGEFEFVLYYRVICWITAVFVPVSLRALFVFQ